MAGQYQEGWTPRQQYTKEDHQYNGQRTPTGPALMQGHPRQEARNYDHPLRNARDEQRDYNSQAEAPAHHNYYDRTPRRRVSHHDNNQLIHRLAPQRDPHPPVMQQDDRYDAAQRQREFDARHGPLAPQSLPTHRDHHTDAYTDPTRYAHDMNISHRQPQGHDRRFENDYPQEKHLSRPGPPPQRPQYGTDPESSSRSYEIHSNGKHQVDEVDYRRPIPDPKRRMDSREQYNRAPPKKHATQRRNRDYDRSREPRQSSHRNERQYSRHPQPHRNGVTTHIDQSQQYATETRRSPSPRTKRTRSASSRSRSRSPMHRKRTRSNSIGSHRSTRSDRSPQSPQSPSSPTIQRSQRVLGNGNGNGEGMSHTAPIVHPSRASLLRQAEQDFDGKPTESPPAKDNPRVNNAVSTLKSIIAQTESAQLPKADRRSYQSREPRPPQHSVLIPRSRSNSIEIDDRNPRAKGPPRGPRAQYRSVDVPRRRSHGSTSPLYGNHQTRQHESMDYDRGEPKRYERQNRREQRDYDRRDRRDYRDDHRGTKRKLRSPVQSPAHAQGTEQYEVRREAAVESPRPPSRMSMDPSRAPTPMIIDSPTPVEQPELYERVAQVGEGTYGKVYKARNTTNGQMIALKRIRMEAEKDGFPVTALREIKLLQSLRHPHVVRFYEMMSLAGAVYMVFEYMEHDLTGVLSHPQFKFEPKHVKSLIKQMLEGLGYLHHRGVLHRDIKGSNILLNSRGELKLADFGLARYYQKRKRLDYTNRVITLWYRPPELLLGATVYGPEVDIWSAGCIVLELFCTKPVFQGNDEIHQLELIYKIMGTPTKETWPDVKELPWYDLMKPKEARSNRFRKYFEKWMGPGALDLAEAMLALDPAKRPSAAEALNMPYFTSEEPAPEIPYELSHLTDEWHEYESKQRKRRPAAPSKEEVNASTSKASRNAERSAAASAAMTERNSQGKKAVAAPPSPRSSGPRTKSHSPASPQRSRRDGSTDTRGHREESKSQRHHQRGSGKRQDDDPSRLLPTPISGEMEERERERKKRREREGEESGQSGAGPGTDRWKRTFTSGAKVSE